MTLPIHLHQGPMSLSNLLKTSRLAVPQFQRAYAWNEKPHVRDFLKDLDDKSKTESSQYFLGTILLTVAADNSGDRSPHYDIVDGQQRLTTACIFVSAALAQLSNLCSSNQLIAECNELFIQAGTRRKFRTIEEDETFFERFVIGPEEAKEGDFATPSQRRLWNAKTFLRKEFAEREEDNIAALLRTLMDSQILVYAVNTNAEATQIFELQNDRGKPLTDLEALKSYLMHGLYLQDQIDVEWDFKSVQQDFAEIYRTAEKIEVYPQVPTEDQILQYHCIAFEEWLMLDDKVYGWRRPKELVKKIVSDAAIRRGMSTSQWIKNCSRRLKDSFTAALQILEARDKIESVGDLFALGREAPFWPLLLKCWRSDSSPARSNFERTVRAMERFAFRSSIARKRSDAGESKLRTVAHEFREDFEDLLKQLNEMRSQWDIAVYYEQGLDRANFYGYYGRAATYLLWRYENHLRRKPGQQWPRLSWKSLVLPETDSKRLSKDHIEPKDGNNPRLKEHVKWNSADIERPFEEVFLHRLGNLVLDSISAGSAKRSGKFQARISHYTNSGLLSQGEIVRDFATKKPDGSLEWDTVAIRLRHDALHKFAMENW